MPRKLSTQATMIVGLSASVTLLSAVIAFAGFANQAHAIQAMAVSSLIYGFAFAWLESGYLLLRSDSDLPASAVYALFASIRVVVFILSGIVGYLFSVSDLPLWKFMLISAGLSSGPAVMSCLRSGKLNAIAIAYLAGVLATLVTTISLSTDDAVQILYIYALLTLVFPMLVALLLMDKGCVALSKSLFLKTRSFFVDLPVTSIVENGDRILLSVVADHNALIAYNAIKVFFGIQRELNKLLKQVLFHHIYDEVGRGENLLIRRFFKTLCATQLVTLLSGLGGFLLSNIVFPRFVDIYIALCVSTAYTFTGTHTVVVASTLHRPSFLFTQANLISLALALITTLLLTSSYIASFVKSETVYVVASCYLLFYASKTFILFKLTFRKFLIR